MKKLLEANTGGGRVRLFQVFRDFCEISALTIRNRVDPDDYDAREARYAEIVGRYSATEQERFAEAFAMLVEDLTDKPTDVLGHLFMDLDLGNERIGQFFTPFNVSLLTAQLSGGHLLAELARKEFVTVHEPAVGSGGMIIAMSEVMRGAGVNFQRRMHVTAWDLDITAVHMAYVQLSLLFVPALIVHGNTLTLEKRDTWPTPAHVLGSWQRRLGASTSAG